MLRFIRRRAPLFLLALMLVGAAFVAFSPRTAAQGGFGYMCDAWEQTCDAGSGDALPGGESGGGGDGGGSRYMCPAPDGCNHFGCHDRSPTDHTQVCNLFKSQPGPAVCPGELPCKAPPR